MYIHRLCKHCSNHSFTSIHAAASPLIAKMVVVETIWQLHTLIVMNSLYKSMNYASWSGLGDTDKSLKFCTGLLTTEIATLHR